MTAQDLQRIRASDGWRRQRVETIAGLDAGTVVVKDQRASRGMWRRRLLNAVARASRLPMLSADARAFGARAQAIELRRLRALATAGVAVPPVLQADADFLVLRHVPGPQLGERLRGSDAAAWWQRGLRLLVHVHRRGEYLNETCPRNFIVGDEGLVAIDCASDPLQRMPLAAAQARDWLAYLFTSIRRLADRRRRSRDAVARGIGRGNAAAACPAGRRCAAPGLGAASAREQRSRLATLHSRRATHDPLARCRDARASRGTARTL